jgi:hypothetical protein
MDKNLIISVLVALIFALLVLFGGGVILYDKLVALIPGAQPAIVLPNLNMQSPVRSYITFNRLLAACGESPIGTLYGPPNSPFTIYFRYNNMDWKVLVSGTTGANGQFIASHVVSYQGSYDFVAVFRDVTNQVVSWSDIATVMVSCPSQTTTTTLSVDSPGGSGITCGQPQYPQCGVGTCPNGPGLPPLTCVPYVAMGVMTCSCQISSSTPSTISYPNCMDSDNGVYPTLAGYVSYQNAEYIDACIGSSNIREQSCSGNVVHTEEYTCGPGYTCVTDTIGGRPLGHCISLIPPSLPSTTTTFAATCFDSSTGPNGGGYVTYGGTYYYDHCEAQGILADQYCDITPRQTFRVCPTGACTTYVYGGMTLGYCGTMQV